jgi:ABC-type Na+ efflux pump permease subunit
MRALAKTATVAVIALGVALALVVAAVAAIGIMGTRSATEKGNEIADDELTTAIVTGQLARNMDAAYAVGQEAVQATVPAERSQLLGTLYASLLPAVDARLFALEQLHAADPPAEHADIELFGRQWATVRNLLSPADLPTSAPSASAASVRAE